jgi:hypothetical protein
VAPETSEVFNFTWEELGVSPELQDAFNGGPGATLWSASWGGVPVQSDFTDAYAVVGAGDGFYASGESLSFSRDGLSWSAMDVPGENQWISTVMPLDAGVIVILTDGMTSTSVYRVDGTAGTWAQLDVPGLPDTLNNSFGSSVAVPAIIVDAAPQQPPQAVSFTVEAAGYSLTIATEFPNVRVTLVADDGTIVLDRTDDMRSGEDPGVLSWNESTVEVLDPESGEVLASFDQALVNQATEAAYIDVPEPEYNPDMWLVATVDGDRWLIDDLDDPEGGSDGPYFGPSGLAINGDTLLVNFGSNWVTYDLS